MTYAVAICLLAQLLSGGRVLPYRLELACVAVQARLGAVGWGSPRDSTGVAWGRSWVHWDEFHNDGDGRWEWYCTEFEEGGESMLVRSSPEGFEALVYPCQPDSMSFVVASIPGPPEMFTQQMSGSPWKEGWVVHRVAEVRIADDSRRRVLARELYGRLPVTLRCPG